MLTVHLLRRKGRAGYHQHRGGSCDITRRSFGVQWTEMWKRLADPDQLNQTEGVNTPREDEEQSEGLCHFHPSCF